MRVGNSSIDHLGSSGTGAVSGVSTESKASGAQSAKSDSVSLSSAASLVALAKAGGSSRQAKVDSIGSQVRSGTYQAGAAEVSHAVVEGHIG